MKQKKTHKGRKQIIGYQSENSWKDWQTRWRRLRVQTSSGRMSKWGRRKAQHSSVILATLCGNRWWLQLWGAFHNVQKYWFTRMYIWNESDIVYQLYSNKRKKSTQDGTWTIVCAQLICKEISGVIDLRGTGDRKCKEYISIKTHSSKSLLLKFFMVFRPNVLFKNCCVTNYYKQP